MASTQLPQKIDVDEIEPLEFDEGFSKKEIILNILNEEGLDVNTEFVAEFADSSVAYVSLLKKDIEDGEMTEEEFTGARNSKILDTYREQKERFEKDVERTSDDIDSSPTSSIVATESETTVDSDIESSIEYKITRLKAHQEMAQFERQNLSSSNPEYGNVLAMNQILDLSLDVIEELQAEK